MLIRKALVVGSGGKLARALIDTAPPGCKLIATPHSVLDITDAASIARMLDEQAPDILLNGAAYNLVDGAEADPESALHVNALGPAVLARACAARGVALVHFSTDFVFDGAKNSPYLETDAARPLSVYGASKLAGENMVLSASSRNFVIRVCRLFGPVADETTRPAGNFPLLMLELARRHGQVRVVNDQIGTPSYTPDVARAVWQLVDAGDGGLFQLCNDGEVSFAEYARAIFEIADIPCQIEAVPSDQYGAPAKRPLYSTLSTEKAQAIGVSPLRH